MDILRFDKDNFVRIAPELGCNVYSWIALGREMLYAPEDFLKRGDPFAGGNPVLFPSVGRTWDRTGSAPVPEKYRIAGITGSFTMPVHGLAAGTEWRRKGEPGETPGSRAEYSLVLSRETREHHYPFETGIDLSIQVLPGECVFRVTVSNLEQRPVPFAFGFHPFFRVRDRASSRVILPCTRQAVLHPELLIPRGEKALTQRELRFEPGQTWDAAFEGLDGPEALLVLEDEHLEIGVSVDTHFRMFVVYSEPDAPFICLEPWTAGIGGYEHLLEDSWKDGKYVPVLGPEETKILTVRYRTEEKE